MESKELIRAGLENIKKMVDRTLDGLTYDEISLQESQMQITSV